MSLLRCVSLLPTLLLSLLALLTACPAHATHLLGGEMTYRYLDAKGPAMAPFRYEITVTIYNNCNLGVSGIAAPNTSAVVGFYNQTTGTKLALTSVNYPQTTMSEGSVTQTGIMNITSYTLSPSCISPRVPLGCAVSGPSQPFRLQRFVDIVNLPASLDGHYAVFTRSARNTDVANITNPDTQALSLYATIPPTLRINHSPVFSDTAVAIICQNDTTITLNNAVDADGDRLVYSFGIPYGAFTGGNGVLPTTAFRPSPPQITYNTALVPGASVTTPFGMGAGNFAILNAATGVAKYGAMTQGKYVVAVDVTEYRTINGREVLVGTTRRDLQLVVSRCPSTRAPVLPTAAVLPRSYTIEEGQTLTVPLSATQADNHALVLTANSVLLDGTGGYNAHLGANPGLVTAGNLTGTATVTGTGTVAATFVYTPACGEARSTPYDVALTVRDVGCAGKMVADLLRITVTRPPGPIAISGDQVVCDPTTPHAYTATGITSSSFRWRVTNGTIIGNATSSTVQVNWNSTGTGTLVARGVSANGCLSDSVLQTVSITPAPPLTVTGALLICQGSSTSLAAMGAGTTYTLVGGGTTQTGSGPFVLSPSQTTTYTITSSLLTNGCASIRQVTVVVVPLPAASVGASTPATCSGTALIIGSAAVTGNTYSWSPATGLSNATVSNPTVTLTNTTSVPVTQRYTLTETGTAGCQQRNTVDVTINPAAIALAGSVQTVCNGQSITLGSIALPGYSYQWVPVTNLSSSTVAQPILTGVNTSNMPLTQKYLVRVTTAQGCAAQDSILITINPSPAMDSISGAVSVCPTVSGISYRIKNPNTTAYQWAVTGGTVAGGQGTPAITVDWGAAGTGAVRVYSTNASGCTSPVFALPVLINRQLQTMKPTGPTNVCQADGPYLYQTLQTNNSSYAWQLAGNAQGTLINVSNTTSITFTRPGIAKLVVTETSNPAGGICRGVSDTLYITVKSSPAKTLALQGPVRFCFNSGPATFTLPGAINSTYAFQLNGATIASTGNVVVIPATTAVGTYTLTARETNSGNCVGPLYIKTFIVDPRPGTSSINGPRFVCPASGPLPYTILNANPTSTFQWSATDGTITSGQGTASVLVSFSAGVATTKTLSVTESSAFGCTGAPVTITIVPDNAQAPVLTVASVEAQDNGKVNLTFAVTNPQATPNPVRILRRKAGTTSAFSQVGTVIATATSYTDATADATQTAYEYRLELTNGCGDSLGNPVNATTSKLTATVRPGTGGRNQGAVQLSWSPYQGFDVGSYQIYQQNDNGIYALVTTVSATTLQANISNSGGNSAIGAGFNQCFRIVAVSTDIIASLSSNSNTACVDFANPLAFYNIITPNGDGQNDVLIIDNVKLYPGNSLSIFNRWGREVYSTTNYQNNWGSDYTIVSGTYYYLFKLANGSTTKGWVEVVK